MATIADAIKMIQGMKMKDSPEVVAAMEDGAKLIEDEAKAYCTPGNPQYYKAPYDEREPHPLEHMREMIDHEVVNKGDRINARVFVKDSGEGEDHHYALYVHTGTYDYNGGETVSPTPGMKGMPPRPVLPDAIAAKRGEAEQLIADGVNAHIRRVMIR